MMPDIQSFGLLRIGMDNSFTINKTAKAEEGFRRKGSDGRS
jgi:hypothetical protein